VCDVVLAAGHTPVILDWDRRSPLPDGSRIFNPGVDHELWGGCGTGDAEVLAALIEGSRLMVGVDSGPLHVAGATSTPTIGVWTRHHPVHYFDLADNVLHLVPGNHAERVHGPQALAYFQQHYRYQTYRELNVDLPAFVESLLTGQAFERVANLQFLSRLSARSFDERYYREHKLAGLDYLGFGDWQQKYGRWLAGSLGLKGKRVLDVGCACGAILRGLGEAGAIIQGVDVNEHMIRLGRDKWPDMASLLFVCDAANLHLFADASFDAIHTAQVAEHCRPDLVPPILRELARVTVPGGLLFCALDTEELFARQGRRIEADDPTHVCIRPMAWWHEQLREAGWQLCSSEFEPALRNHPESFLPRYDWDWFVGRKP
jgi:2-polyprenyl-3-methyl-5-hydroxy-6-metoxy-1,4-benzoquinol methylase